MSRYAEAAATVTAHESDLPDTRTCDAAGCPLPGTIGDATNGPTRWYCRLHHGAPISAHANITARAANRRRLYVLAYRLMNAPTAIPVPHDVSEWVTRQNRADLLAALAAHHSGRMTARHLGATMLTILDRECREPQQRIEQADEQPAAKPNTWQLGRELLQGL